MEKNIWDMIGQYLDWILFLLVLAGGYFQSAYLKGIKLSKSNDATVKTLLMGSIFCFIYLAILKMNGQLPKEVWAKYFFSYVAATSFYEIILKPFNIFIERFMAWWTNKVNKMFGKDKADPPVTPPPSSN